MAEEKNMTAVDFLIEMTKPVNWSLASWKEHYAEVFAKAKEMEKEQIIEARMDGINSALKGYAISNEQYYNETYKSE